MAAGVAEASELPIKTIGREHVGMQVPDQESAAKFYGRIFDPQLFQERDWHLLYSVRRHRHQHPESGASHRSLLCLGARLEAAREAEVAGKGGHRHGRRPRHDS
jgi:hypothetical protein